MSIWNSIGNFLAGVGRQVNPLDNNATFKNPQGNAPQYIAQGQAPPSAAQQATAFGRGIVHPYSTFGSAVVHTPEAIYRELQNKPITDIQQRIFGTTNQGNIAKQIIGDTANVGLTVAAPGISKVAGGLLPEGANLATRVGTGALANEGINTAFGVAGQYGSGQKINVGQAAKQAIGPTAFGVGVELAPHVVSHIKSNPLNQVGAVGKDVNEMGGLENTIENRKLVLDKNPEIKKLAQTADNFEAKYGTNSPKYATISDALDYRMNQALENGGVEPPKTTQPKTPSLSAGVSPKKTGSVSTPVNETPSVGQGSGMTPLEQQLGHKIEASKYNGPNLNEGAFSEADMAKLSKMAAADEAKLKATKSVPDRPITPPSEERANIIKQENQQTTNKIDLNVPEGNVKGAIAKAVGVEDERLSRAQRADLLGQKLNEHDQKLLSERADPKVKINPDNPKAFEKAAAAYDDAYDYHLAANRAAGGTTLRYGNGKYAPLYLKASVEQMDKMQIPADERYTAGGFTGFRDAARKYRSYTDADKQAGLKPLFNSPLEDAQVYFRSSHAPIGNALLQTTLKQAAPKDVAEIGFGVDENGRRFNQAAGNLPFNASPELQKALRNFSTPYEPKSVAGRVAMKTGEKLNTITKRSLFFGTPFHYMNITKNFEGLSGLTGHEIVAGKGLAEALASAGTKENYSALLDHFRKTGTLDQARSMGIILPERSRMDRFINGYALTLADAAKKHGVDPSSQLGTDLGQMYNKVLGRMNDRVEGTNPTLAKLWSNASLAPHYFRTQLGLVKDALTKRGTPIGLYTPGGVARGTIAGARALEALAAITTSAIILNRLPTGKEALQEAGLNPNNPVPNVKLKSTNAAGHGQVMNFPTDPLGLTVGLVTDPKHFAQSRFSPALSFGSKVATNTNWAGQPLATMDHPGAWVTRVKNAAINSVVPIGVQNFTNLQKNANNPNVLQGIAQEFGGRLKTDPNDPAVRAFALQNKLVGSQPADVKNAFNDVFGKQVDSSGNPKQTVIQDSQLARLSGYQSTPATLDKLLTTQKQIQDVRRKNGLPTDPFFDGTLNRDQQQVLLTIKGRQERDKADVQSKIMEGQNADWLTPYYAQRNSYFQSLGLSPSKQSQPPLVQFPTVSTSLQSKFNQMDSLSGADKANFLANNPDIIDYFSQYDAAVRQQHDIYKEPQYDTYPQTTPQIQAVMNQYNSLPKGTGARSSWIKSNPQAYQAMTQYLTQVSLYNLEQSAAKAQFQGQGFDQKGLKAISNLGQYDIGKQTDANGNTFYALGSGGSGSSSGGYASGKLNPSYRKLSMLIPKVKTASFGKFSSKGSKVKVAKLRTKIPTGSKVKTLKVKSA